MKGGSKELIRTHNDHQNRGSSHLLPEKVVRAPPRGLTKSIYPLLRKSMPAFRLRDLRLITSAAGWEVLGARERFDVGFLGFWTGVRGRKVAVGFGLTIQVWMNVCAFELEVIRTAWVVIRIDFDAVRLTQPHAITAVLCVGWRESGRRVFDVPGSEVD